MIVEVDIKGVVDSINSHINYSPILRFVAERYVEELRGKVNSSLKGGKEAYLNSIKMQCDEKEATIYIDTATDPIVKGIEEGKPPFDMKIGLLNGQKAKVSKKGVKYATIPIRFRNPQAKGSLGGELSINFRRVSDNSNPASWIHPGIEKRDFLNKTLIDFDIKGVVEDFFIQNSLK